MNILLSDVHRYGSVESVTTVLSGPQEAEDGVEVASTARRAGMLWKMLPSAWNPDSWWRWSVQAERGRPR